jgi:hypothetical protein
MRPLGHLGVGMDTADYDLCVSNEPLYDQLSERGELLIADAKKEFMGHYHNNPPIQTRDELQKDCDNWLNKKQRLQELRAPAELINAADEHIVESYKAIQSKKYGSMSDPVYKKYRESYFAKEEAWGASAQLADLLTEIYAYNENEYNKFKESQSSTN